MAAAERKEKTPKPAADTGQTISAESDNAIAESAKTLEVAPTGVADKDKSAPTPPLSVVSATTQSNTIASTTNSVADSLATSGMQVEYPQMVTPPPKPKAPSPEPMEISSEDEPTVQPSPITIKVEPRTQRTLRSSKKRRTPCSDPIGIEPWLPDSAKAALIEGESSGIPSSSSSSTHISDSTVSAAPPKKRQKRDSQPTMAASTDSDDAKMEPDDPVEPETMQPTTAKPSKVVVDKDEEDGDSSSSSDDSSKDNDDDLDANRLSNINSASRTKRKQLLSDLKDTWNLEDIDELGEDIRALFDHFSRTETRRASRNVHHIDDLLNELGHDSEDACAAQLISDGIELQYTAFTSTMSKVDQRVAEDRFPHSDEEEMALAHSSSKGGSKKSKDGKQKKSKKDKKSKSKKKKDKADKSLSKKGTKLSNTGHVVTSDDSDSAPDSDDSSSDAVWSEGHKASTMTENVAKSEQERDAVSEEEVKNEEEVDIEEMVKCLSILPSELMDMVTAHRNQTGAYEEMVAAITKKHVEVETRLEKAAEMEKAVCRVLQQKHAEALSEVIDGNMNMTQELGGLRHELEELRHELNMARKANDQKDRALAAVRDEADQQYRINKMTVQHYYQKLAVARLNLEHSMWDLCQGFAPPNRRGGCKEQCLVKIFRYPEACQAVLCPACRGIIPKKMFETRITILREIKSCERGMRTVNRMLMSHPHLYFTTEENELWEEEWGDAYPPSAVPIRELAYPKARIVPRRGRMVTSAPYVSGPSITGNPEETPDPVIHVASPVVADSVQQTHGVAHQQANGMAQQQANGVAQQQAQDTVQQAQPQYEYNYEYSDSDSVSESVSGSDHGCN